MNCFCILPWIVSAPARESRLVGLSILGGLVSISIVTCTSESVGRPAQERQYKGSTQGLYRAILTGIIYTYRSIVD